MKQMKAKLVSAIVMLVVAAVMMSTASYAWFTISTAPEISEISSTVCANGNLEIALDSGVDASKLTKPADSASGDAGQNIKWGNLVDLKAAFVDGTNSKVQLRPVEVTFGTGEGAQGTVKYPEFGKDGRISALTTASRVKAADGAKDNFNDVGGVWYFNDGGSKAWAFEVDYWLRTNVAGGVKLETGTAVDRGAGETGNGSYIKNTNGMDVTIVLVDQKTGTQYKLEKSAADANGKCTLSLGTDASIPLTANEEKAIRMYVYLDGATLTNKDFANTVGNMEMNIQFVHTTKLEDLDVNGTNYGRDTAGTITPSN